MANSSKIMTSTVEAGQRGALLNIDHDIELEVFHAVKALPGQWDELALQSYPLHARWYLSIIEKHPPEGMALAYGCIYRKGQLIGIMPMQSVKFEAGSSFKNQPDANNGACFFETIKRNIRVLVQKRISLQTLVAGNLLISGSPAAVFEPSLTHDEQCFLTEKAIRRVSEYWQPEGENIGLQLIKDMIAPCSITDRDGFVKVNIQPSMELRIPSDWNTFEDYLAAISSRYRVRYRRALKLLGAIQYRRLLPEEAGHYGPLLYRLYRQVVSDADFNMVHLRESYFKTMLQSTSEGVHICGWFLNSELIGFHSTIPNGSKLEAHYIGFDKQYNSDHQLYLNMLFAILDQGIREGFHNVNFSRTALEIKSSLGAEPIYYHSYLRHRRHIAKSLVKGAVRILNPPVAWQARHPFKQQ